MYQTKTNEQEHRDDVNCQAKKTGILEARNEKREVLFASITSTGKSG